LPTPLLTIILFTATANIMAKQKPRAKKGGAKPAAASGSAAGDAADTQLQRRKHLPSRRAANIATQNISNDQKLKIVRKSKSNHDKSRQAVGCEFI
jgi:hypothetical protein